MRKLVATKAFAAWAIVLGPTKHPLQRWTKTQCPSDTLGHWVPTCSDSALHEAMTNLDLLAAYLEVGADCGGVEHALRKSWDLWQQRLSYKQNIEIQNRLTFVAAAQPTRVSSGVSWSSSRIAAMISVIASSSAASRAARRSSLSPRSSLSSRLLSESSSMLLLFPSSSSSSASSSSARSASSSSSEDSEAWVLEPFLRTKGEMIAFGV